MSERIYPDESAGPFPPPPRTVEDAEGRPVDLRATDEGEREPIVEMYVAFDPSDRAQGIPPAGEDRIRSWVDTLLDEGLNVIAVHDGAVVGHATLMPELDGDAWELAIFVTQSHQGAGIGTELVRTLLGHGADRGVEYVWLTVERWNRPAIALYRSVGFEPSDAESFEMEMTLLLDSE